MDGTAHHAWQGDAPPGAARPADDPEIAYWRQLAADRVRAAIAALPDARDREVIARYFLGDPPMTDGEIAIALHMPHDTVTWRRRRAVTQLRAHFDGPPKTPGADGVSLTVAPSARGVTTAPETSRSVERTSQ